MASRLVSKVIGRIRRKALFGLRLVLPPFKLTLGAVSAAVVRTAEDTYLPGLPGDMPGMRDAVGRFPPSPRGSSRLGASQSAAAGIAIAYPTQPAKAGLLVTPGQRRPGFQWRWLLLLLFATHAAMAGANLLRQPPPEHPLHLSVASGRGGRRCCLAPPSL